MEGGNNVFNLNDIKAALPVEGLCRKFQLDPGKFRRVVFCEADTRENRALLNEQLQYSTPVDHFIGVEEETGHLFLFMCFE